MENNEEVKNEVGTPEQAAPQTSETPQTVNGFPMDQIIDPLSTTLSQVDEKPAEPQPAAPVQEKKKSNLIPIIIIVVCAIIIVLLLIKPWAKKDEGTTNDNTKPVNEVNTTEEEKTYDQYYDFENSVEGDIDPNYVE